MNSILTSIKKLLNISEEYEHFDTDIIILINSALSALTQIGVGPAEGFVIKDKTAEWSSFMYDDPKLELVKTYVYLKVKIVFDPPTSGAAMDAIKATISEYEWRLNVAADTAETVK